MSEKENATLEKKESKKKREPYKIILVSAFFLFLLAIPILTFINLPEEDRPFSENENRYLSGFPEISVEAYLDKSAMTGFESWFADRFFGREAWIKLKNGTERFIGKTEVNGIFTEDDRMMQVWEGYDKDFIDKNLSAVNAFAEKNPDIPVNFMLAPTSQEIYSNLLPDSAPIGSQAELNEYCRDNLDCSYIDIFPTMMAHADEYIYYRTDHHWTTYGAYVAYTEASKALGFQATPLSDFDIEHASSEFRGTLYSKTLDDGVTPDIIDYYHFNGGNNDLTLTVNDGREIKEYDSLYFREYLEKKDKYSSFMGTNSPVMTITSEDNRNGQSILIFKDSYAHAFIPFLTNHYSNITVLDMRYINAGYSSIVDMSEFDSVLILYNAITFSEDSNIRKLRMG